ncbi:MAG: hypothetical protein MUE83_07800 [Tabrizicola sp.]|jgi:hypothetical protein|nr:hypothetical protein [Tabrizicola sp.]
MKPLTAALLCLPLLPAPKAVAAGLCPLVAELNRVLVEATDYQPVPCPEIGFSVLDGQPGMRSQAGAYFPETGQIELAPDLDLTTAYGQSFLLHEMVHAAQFAEGADGRAPCPAALEAEAYAVQARFLQAAGLTREALLTGMLGQQLGACGAQPDY